MPTDTITTTSTFSQLQDIIAQETGLDYEAITPSSLLEELNMEDFPRIVIGVNTHFEIVLRPKEVLHECETVADFVQKIDDELELG